MPKRYVQNDTTAPIFIGGCMIAPGDGREVDEMHLPPAAGDGDGAAALPDQADPDASLKDMLTGSVKALVATLPDASDETLAGLARLENEAEKPRSTLLAAIAELQLTRAQAASGGAPE